jgi:hypothetical protein
LEVTPGGRFEFVVAGGQGADGAQCGVDSITVGSSHN